MDMVYLQVFLLIIAANGAPIIGRLLMRGRWSMPLDHGAIFPDGRRVLGDSKTFRGVVFALLGSILAADVVGLSWATGLIVGGLAMVGDCFSSFIKRRLGYESGAMALGLDQILESLLPLLALWGPLSLSATGIVVTVVAFAAFELLFSPLLYKFHIRKHPY